MADGTREDQYALALGVWPLSIPCRVNLNIWKPDWEWVKGVNTLWWDGIFGTNPCRKWEIALSVYLAHKRVFSSQCMVPKTSKQGILFVRKGEKYKQKSARKVPPVVSNRNDGRMLTDLHSLLKEIKAWVFSQFPSKSWGVFYILRIKAYSDKTWVLAIPSKRIGKLGHETFNGHFARKKLKLNMAPFYNSNQSKKLQPNMSLDERLHICARVLNNFLKV